MIELTKIEAYQLAAALAEKNLHIKHLSIEQLDQVLSLKMAAKAATEKLMEVELLMAREYGTKLTPQGYEHATAEEARDFTEKINALYKSPSGLKVTPFIDDGAVFKSMIEDIADMESVAMLFKCLRKVKI